MAKILVLSGPNLDRLGKREPAIYGKQTLQDIHALLELTAAELGASVECRQSNHEGLLIDWIGSAGDDGFAGILFNPGAYTHTSYALYDALRAVGLPTVEVHLSNPDAREEFRRVSTVAPACVGRVSGFGAQSYVLALRGLVERLARERATSGRRRTAGGKRNAARAQGTEETPRRPQAKRGARAGVRRRGV